MTNEAFDLEGFKALRQEVTASGISWDKLEADPKKYVSNYRRICPKRPDWQFPFQVFFVHYAGPTNRMLGCPREMRIAAECPLCNHGFGLIRQGAKEEGKSVLPSMRVFMNALRLRADGSLAEEKVFLLAVNQSSFWGGQDSEDDEILANLFEEYGDLSHIEDGRNLEIRARVVKRGRYEFKNLKYTVSEPCPFPGTEELLDQLYDLPNVVPFVEPKEMVDIFEGRNIGASLLSPAANLALPAPSPSQAPEVVAAPPRGGFAIRDGQAPSDDAEETGDDTPTPSDDAEETGDDTPTPEVEAEPKETRRQRARAGTAAPPKTQPGNAAERLRQRLDKTNG